MRYVALAAVLLAIPQMASAQDQTTGTVNVTGTVAGRCSVVGGGQSFNDSINLGELAGNDGRLRADLTGETAAAVRNFSVVCTSATPRVELSATRLSTPGTAPDGYASDIDFTAEIAVDLSSGTPPPITYTTNSSLPAPEEVQLPAPLATTPDNVTLSVHSFYTDDLALLVAGDYTSVISITISPT